MKTKLAAWVVALCVGAMFAYSVRAEEHHEGRGGGEEHHGGAVRAAPPRFQAHPPGAHPHGPTVRPHATRVLAPRVIVYGHHNTWHHWTHPEFSRPSYYWDWNVIKSVTCISEDSYGDQYPVTESTFSGFGLNNMTQIEDDSLDRCYQESGNDPNCYLATCSHF
jgi:hypothetical protein